MKKGFLVLALAAGLSGCAAMQEQQAAFNSEFQRTIPVCEGQEQCEMAWAHARNWVIQNCGMKIQNITDTYIETYGSTTTALACRVMGQPQGPGSWAMVITTTCGNMFGCVPDARQSALRFNREVSQALGLVPGQTAAEAAEAAAASAAAATAPVDIPIED